MSTTSEPSASSDNQELRRQLFDLSLRVARVEQRVGIRHSAADTTPSTIIPHQSTPVAPQPAEAPSTSIPPIAAPPVAPVPATEPPITAAPLPVPRPVPITTTIEEIARARRDAMSAGAIPLPDDTSGPALDWESLIGGKWALWVGSISMFLAIAFFLAYTWRFMPPPPPEAKVGGGIAVGIAALIAGVYFRERTQRWFSEGLFGIGLGILYLSIWAAAQHFHLISFSLAFVSLTTVTALGVFLSVRYDAIRLITLATIGGFLTPILLHTDGNSGSAVPFLTYIGVLNTGIVAVSLFRRWQSIVWLSFVATLLVVGGWAIDSYTTDIRWTTFVFLTIYFLLFFGASCFYSLAHREETAHHDLLLLFSAFFVYAVAGFETIHGSLGAAPAAFPLGLALFLALAGITTRTLAPDNLTLRYSTGALSLLCLTMAIPIQLEQQWLAVGWTAEAGVLLLLSSRFRSPLLQRAGQIVWLLSLWSVGEVLLDGRPTLKLLFVNEKALPLLASIVVAALVTANLIRLEHKDESWQDSFAPWYAAYATIAGAWLIAQETELAFYLWHAAKHRDWQPEGMFIIACLWSIYALGLFSLGLRFRHLALRSSALCVAAVATTLPLWFGATSSDASWTPFWNLRWLSYVVVGASVAMLGGMLTREKAALEPDEAETLSYWPAGTILFLLAGMTTEVWFAFARGQAHHWYYSAFFAIAMLWSVCAMLTLLLGYTWRQPPLRTLACFIGFAGAVMLLLNAGVADTVTTPLFNLRVAAFGVVITSLSLAILISQKFQAATSDDEDILRDCIRLLSTLVLVWGATQEAYGACRYFKSSLGADWQIFALFVVIILWQLMAGVLWSIGLRHGLTTQRLAAYALGALACSLLLINSMQATQLDWAPLFNIRFACFAIATAGMAAIAFAIKRYAHKVTLQESAFPLSLGLLAVTVLLWGLTQESYEMCHYYRAILGASWTRWAQMIISLVWSLYAALLLIGGISRQHQPVRLAGLSLLALTVCKVFLFDLSFLDTSLRILSLAGLGAALIFISWLYSRFGIESAAAKA